MRGAKGSLAASTSDGVDVRPFPALQRMQELARQSAEWYQRLAALDRAVEGQDADAVSRGIVDALAEPNPIPRTAQAIIDAEREAEKVCYYAVPVGGRLPCALYQLAAHRAAARTGQGGASHGTHRGGAAW